MNLIQIKYIDGKIVESIISNGLLLYFPAVVELSVRLSAGSLRKEKGVRKSCLANFAQISDSGRAFP